MPQAATAATGGTGLATAGRSGVSSGNPSGTSTVVTQPGNAMVSATGNGITVSVRESAMLRKGLTFTGLVPASDAGDTIEVERLGHETNGTWAATAHGTANSAGAFTAFWPANHIGRFQIRAVVEAPNGASARAGTPSPPVTVTVYRPSIATWYGGPGEYGAQTACGVTLRKNTLGVASRTLPCGTQVALYYRGRTMVVPVIDRGPYANHADWDLTAAVAKALGTYVAGVVTIGAVSLPAQ